MIQLHYNIAIAKPKEYVWNTMLQRETYEQWVGKSWPNSTYEGEWKQGSEIRFVAKDGSGGTLAVIKELRPYEYVLAEHIAALQKGGIIDKDSEMAKGWIGSLEAYTFTQTGNDTLVEVLIETNPAWRNEFDRGWNIALPELKRICEES